jgi:hypothetical protein
MGGRGRAGRLACLCLCALWGGAASSQGRFDIDSFLRTDALAGPKEELRQAVERHRSRVEGEQTALAKACMAWH